MAVLRPEPHVYRPAPVPTAVFQSPLVFDSSAFAPTAVFLETGIYGDPTLATAEFGEVVFAEAVRNLEGFCREYHAVEAADWSSSRPEA